MCDKEKNMSIYFCFSDENGDYLSKRSSRFVQRHNYYNRSVLIIDAADWRKMHNGINSLKKEFGFAEDIEIKWAHIWSLRYFQKNGTSIPRKSEVHFLKSIDYHNLIDFVDNALKLLSDLSFCKIVFTITHNKSDYKFSIDDCYKMHLRSMLQRIQMEIQATPEALAVLFVDPVSDPKCKILRNTYNDIRLQGDWIRTYSNIKDSLNIEYSHHSTGVQLADFLAGCFAGFLKGYDRSVEIFNQRILPHVRRSVTGSIMGYGIVEVPTSPVHRKTIAQKL